MVLTHALNPGPQPGFGELDDDAQLVFNWNQVFWGATTLLAKLTNAGAYHLLVRASPWPSTVHLLWIYCLQLRLAAIAASTYVCQPP